MGRKLHGIRHSTRRSLSAHGLSLSVSRVQVAVQWVRVAVKQVIINRVTAIKTHSDERRDMQSTERRDM